ncbi:MAG: alpha/beta hydrolase [Actinomycetia bacterium]|nr:alpha/beta hydrolase [Actinomycetes bacterium]
MAKQKVFIIHGWTYSLNRWDEAMRELGERGYEPVMLKVPGLSESSDAVWDVGKYVEWLGMQLKSEKHTIIIGHSNGGRIAMAYDVAHPGQIKHLFLVSSAGIYHDSQSASMRRKVFGGVSKVLKPIARGPIRRVLYRLIGASDYGNAKPNMRQTMVNVTDHDKTFDVSQVSAPATLIWGREDKATPVDDAQQIQSRLQNPGELRIFPGVGHSPHGDKPGEFADIVDETIKGL